MADMMNAILKFLGSKWFTLVLMALMGVFLPTTWNNLSVVLDKGQLASFWYIAVVFVCNVLGLLMAFWKFMGQMTNKQSTPSSTQKW
jgi:hypothetical protein